MKTIEAATPSQIQAMHLYGELAEMQDKVAEFALAVEDFNCLHETRHGRDLGDSLSAFMGKLTQSMGKLRMKFYGFNPRDYP